ncbi:hypothetical protein C5E45_20095 [Nocardia nova]|uniref:Peptidase C14 caspase domain-containing protein n=1 Tax=Nocardia nova TaxID=37330 RepID=A0A2S6AM90_9NOCA|nr:tetratricopeptide repeat protein [Nocardia nova]PPJ36357.1 hypothetical protein C5E45_20095 [Nocardia nova]
MRLPDADLSRALLLGASKFSDAELPDLPAVRNNLTALAEILTSSWATALAPQHCVALPDEDDRSVIGDRLTSAAEQAEDMLLVYYAGHGLIGPDGDLYLSMPATRIGRKMLAWTALPFETVRRTLADARAENRILILDCCFSGRAIGTMTDVTSAVVSQISVKGTCTLASSPANRPSSAPTTAKFTAYTGELLHVLHRGPGDDAELLTINAIHEHLATELPSKGFPPPEQRNTGTISRLALARRPPSHHYADFAPAPRDSSAAATPAAILHDRSATASRERELRRVAAEGGVRAMLELGALLEERGELADADHWYYQAASMNSIKGALSLAALFEKQGQPRSAEVWWDKAVSMGSTLAMIRKGRKLLEGSNDWASAERWYRAAADKGDPLGMNNLTVLLADHGRPDEAVAWARRAANAGDASGMFNLATLLLMQGLAVEARSWFERSAGLGDTDAMASLAGMLQEQGDLSGASCWFDKSANAGNPRGMNGMGVLRMSQGEWGPAEVWFRRGANAGDCDAMGNLAYCLVLRGDLRESEFWCHRANKAGNTFAKVVMGRVLKARGQIDAAQSWWEAAARAGEKDAMLCLAETLLEQGDPDKATHWYRRATSSDP